MKSNFKIKIANTFNSLILICLFGLFQKGNAATITVSSVSNLQLAINNSNPGDVLILANGTYFNSSLIINNSNIIIKAESPGGVFLNGSNKIIIEGNYVTFSGFQFTNGDIGTNYIIEVSGSHNLLTQLNFSGYFAKKYIQIKAGSQYNEISYCNIEKKPVAAEIGCTIQISTSPTIPGYHKIRYCSFRNFDGAGGDFGNEPIRIGLSTENDNQSRTVVEYCYFNNTGLGDSETISVKCQENIVRYCTFTNQQNGMLSFRNGDNNLAYGNFFIKAGGIRVKETNTVFCYNNYFENSANPVVFVYDTSTYPVVLKNINFIHNTFYNCGDIDLGGNGPTENTWANNIFKSNTGNIFFNPNNGTIWQGNLYQGVLGIPIASGMKNIDTQLISIADGYYGLSATSPAIDASNANYPAIINIANMDDDSSLLLDIGGQERPVTISLKDVGCDEFTTGTTTNHPLILSEVGPSYLGGPSLSSYTNEILNKMNEIQLFPNPVKDSFTIETFNQDCNLIKASIYNSNGQLVKWVENLQKVKNDSQISFQDLSDLNNGIYFVKVEFDKGSKIIKLILEK